MCILFVVFNVFIFIVNIKIRGCVYIFICVIIKVIVMLILNIIDWKLNLLFYMMMCFVYFVILFVSYDIEWLLYKDSICIRYIFNLDI